MRYLTIILWLCLSTVCLAQTAVDFQKWQLDDTTFQVRLGDPIQNYPTETTWAEIENDFVLIGDTMTARHAYMKTDVLPNGVSQITIEHNDTTYTITQRPVKLIWLNTSTWNWIDVADAPSWGTPAVDSNIIKWTGVFPGVDYRIRKQKARVDHGIYFKPAFLDSAVILYNQRADSLDIALANVMEYTLSANIDSADIGVGNVNKRVLKQVGKHVFGLAASRLHFPGSDTLQTYAVNHRWVKQSGKIYCIEYIKMRKIKIIHEAYPTATIWHNDSPHTISGTTNVEDGHFVQSASANNYGGLANLQVRAHSSFEYRVPIRCKNVSSELGVGATVTNCKLYFYNIINNLTANYAVYRIFKPWVEGTATGSPTGTGVTWSDWQRTTLEWGTSGCANADDGGSDNSGDGTGADRKATAEDTKSVDAVDTWFYWTISNALVQGWYAETINEEGVLLEGTGAGDESYQRFESTEAASNQPYWLITFTTNGAPAVGQVIIIN